MLKTLAVLLATLGVSCAMAEPSPAPASRPAAQPATAPRPLAIAHATLVDPAMGRRDDVTILMRDGLIEAVGPSAQIEVPAGAVVHDARGRFVLPGLWDMHVHVSQIGDDAAKLFIANGVTTVRDMASDLADIERWRRGGVGIAPTIYTSGPKLSGRGRAGRDTTLVATPEAVSAEVAALAARGVDFIKIHNGFTVPMHEAVAKAARAHKLAFAGHIGGVITPPIAAANGQRSIEHGYGMLDCPAQLRARIRAEDAYLETLCVPEGRSSEILAALVEANVYFTPTLTSWRGKLLDPSGVARMSGIEHATPALQEWWRKNTGDPLSALEQEVLRQFGPLAGQAARAGVRVLAGTDAGDPNVVPGFALHDELQLLVDSGLTPLQALRAATLDAAAALDATARGGSVEPGKVADLVLLSADPLAEIGNTRKIIGVVKSGRLMGEKELRSLFTAP